MSYLDKIKVADETYDIKDSSAAHSVNGQSPDASGNVAVAVPTKTSELENDSNFQNSTQTTATANAAVATHNTSNTAHADIRETLSGKQAALDTAQMAAVNSGADSTKVGQIATNATDISTINGKIPAAASSSNQLADKSFVNSTVQTASANFRGNWATWNDVPTDANDYPADADGNKTPTKNDYMVVQDASGFPTSPDPALAGTWRFKYSGTWATDGKNGWHPEYQVNETPLTSDQLAALNSGITAEAVTKLSGIETGAEVNDIDSISVNGTAVTPDENKNVALTIPTVNDATLTITQNGTSAGTFTANASTDATIALTDTTYTAFTGATASTAGAAGLVPAPAAGDESKVLKGDGTWAAPEGGIKTLTTADYNWPTNAPAGIAPWLLDAGLYRLGNSGDTIRLYTAAGTFSDVVNTPTLFVMKDEDGCATFFARNDSQKHIQVGTVDSTGTNKYVYGSPSFGFSEILTNNSLRNSLSSTDSGYALDSRQGKVLKNLIDGSAIGTTETLAIATSDWAALASSDPYDYSATVTAATAIGANSLVELINDQAVLFATHGFAIGAISGQSVTIYSVGQPSASVSLKINVKG